MDYVIPNLFCFLFFNTQISSLFKNSNNANKAKILSEPPPSLFIPFTLPYIYIKYQNELFCF